MTDPGCSHQINISGTLTLYRVLCCMLKIRGERWQRSLFPGSLYSHWGRPIASKSVHPMALDSGYLRFELEFFDSQSSHSTIQVLFTLRLRANNMGTNIYTPIHLSIQPSVCPSIHLIIHLPIHSSICPSIYLSIQLSIHLSIHPSTHSSICSSICPSIYLYVHLSVHPSIHPSIHSSIQRIKVTTFS